MAHFAELNSSNEVLRVIVVSNDDVDANGGDQHADAETFVTTIVPYGTGGVAWKQCSYNNKFISDKPYPSWALDSNDDWQAPVNKPDDVSKNYIWNETDRQWEEVANG
jgi:hypothetical protein